MKKQSIEMSTDIHDKGKSQTSSENDERSSNASSLSKQPIGANPRMSIDADRVLVQQMDQFLSKSIATWTINDQMRLNSLDSLYRRSIEYHNNVHTKESVMFTQFQDEPDKDFQSTDFIAQVSCFTEDNSRQILHQYSYLQFQGYCQTTLRPLLLHQHSLADPQKSVEKPHNSKGDKDKKERIYIWIHVKDLIALKMISDVYTIHPLQLNSFYDRRPHSSFLAIDSAANSCMDYFVSNSVCSLNDNQFQMYKLYSFR
jgi:hypothetical protein